MPVDQRRPAKLPRRVNHHVVQHPPVIEVFHQRRHRMVERDQLLFQPGVDIVVMIPIPGVDRHTGAPRLHQPAGQQGALTIQMPAVPVPQRIGLCREIERLFHCLSGHHVERLGLERVEPRQHSRGIHIAPQRVELLQQPGPRLHALDLQPLGQRQVRNPELLRIRIGIHLERVVRRPQVNPPLVPKRLGLGDGHIRRHLRRARTKGPRNDRSERRLLRRVAGQRRAEHPRLHPMRRWGMNPVLMLHRPHHRQPVHHPGDPRPLLGHLDAGHHRINRPVVSPVLAGSLGLEIDRVLLAHAAMRPEDNHRPMALPSGTPRRRCRIGLGPQPQHIGQPQAQRRGPQFQQPPPREPAGGRQPMHQRALRPCGTSR